MQVRWYDGYVPTFNDFFRLRDELDQLFDIGLPLSNIRSVPRGTFPAINIQEQKDSVCIDACLPGVDPKDVDLTIEDNALTIKGRRNTGNGGGNYHRRERFSGEFTRIVSLPEGLDSNKAEARYHEGILSITIARAEEKKPKQIAVSVA
ncbi:MAG: Hsp20/alpha crystallin family protein [Deltaproteobacteria bacterium]|nr:Hsp20/alpha crystallin family protein [Deltaproteobacteria bacterium]